MKRVKSWIVVVAFATLFLAVGCTTTQSPERQVIDAKITAEVKSKLATDVKASTLANISVNTTNGVVTLAGSVTTEEAKTSAELVAKALTGVRRVNTKTKKKSVGRA